MPRATPHPDARATLDDPPTAIDERTRTTFAGRYEVQRLLGSGGMGAVYLARDRELDEEVALKVLRPELCTDDRLELFRREVRLARRVTHPNVARVHDIGEADGVWYLTMEHVPGASLSSVLAEGRMSPQRAIALGVELCRALGAAHARGVVHRDLKPDNVLVGDDGRVVVTDFGIARAVDPGSRTLTHGLPVGTPAYMAPEQVEALPDIDVRADLYALGVVLFEALTGRLPFVGPALEQAALRLAHAPPDPRSLRPELDARLSAVVLRLLERDRGRRFATAAEVEAALAALVDPLVTQPTEHQLELDEPTQDPPTEVSGQSSSCATEGVWPKTDAEGHALEGGADSLDARTRARAVVVVDPSATIDALEQALLASPDDPAVLTSFALASLRAFFLGVEGPAAYHRARRSAMRAVELDKSRVDARHAVALCHLHAGDELTAVRILRRLAQRAEASFVHESLGALMLEAGALDTANAHLERAAALDPGAVLTGFELVRLAVYQRDAPLVEQRLEAISAKLGERGEEQLTAIRLRIAIWRGEHAAVMQLARASGSSGLLPDAAVDALARGEFRVALGAVARHAGAAHSTRRAALLAQIEAELALLIGDDASAIAAIDRAIDVGFFDLAWLRCVPAFDAVRDVEPFASRMASVRARAERVWRAYEDALGPAAGAT
jgi:tetratricopeptide (TPR) repeat protein